MSGSLQRFMEDRRGTTFEGIALSVSIIAVGFVASADMIDYLIKKHNAERSTVIAKPVSVPSRDLDETPTASLPKLVSRSVLDPCTGQMK